MRTITSLFVTLLVLQGCAAPPDDKSAQAPYTPPYPHRVIAVDGEALLAGDLRQNIRLRDGDVIWPSDTPAYPDAEHVLDRPDRVRVSEIGTRRDERWAYRAKPGDTLLVTVYELREPGLDDQQARRITDDGDLRLAGIGLIHAANRTSSELERDIARKLEFAGKLRDATVSVQFLKTQASVRFRLMALASTGAGDPDVVAMTTNDFRLLEALKQRDNFPESHYKHLYIIRRVEPK